MKIFSKKPAKPEKITKNNSAKNIKKKGNLKGLLIRLGIIGGAIGIFFFFFGIHFYYGNNMITSLRDGELIIVSKTSAPLADRVIAYTAEGQTHFGRIIGLAGDEIEITKDKYTINGSVPTEQIFFDTTNETDLKVTVPENAVFVLNDYREDKNDSRTYGAIDKKDIKGVVVFTMSRRGF